MKLKLSFIAAAMVVAGQAHATIATGVGLNDQLFLSVWDPVAQASYSRGLGLTDQSLVSGFGINFGASTSGSGFTATGGTSAQNYSLAADANLSSFLTTYAADAASMQWSVVGGGSPNVNYNTPIAVTSNSMTTGWSSTLFGGMIAFNGAYLATSGINGLMPAGSVAGNLDSAVATSANGSAYALNTQAYFGDQLGNVAPFHTAAGLNVAQNFYLLNPTTNGRSYGGAANVYTFANTTGTASTWTLASNGTLTFNVAQSVAAVPEPGEWALMLSGFGLFGFIAKRRQARMA